MKIEKINENQIRCTLTREDLESHQVNLKELAYGSEKAKKLFRDMMQQAQIQFGFEADNIPLMIEAIPVNLDSVILIVTIRKNWILVFPNFHHIRIMLRQNHFNLTEQTTLLISSRKYVRQK